MKVKRKSFKIRLIAGILVMAQIITMNSITSLATNAGGLEDNPNNGDVEGGSVDGVSDDNGKRADAAYQGLRFYIVDANGNRVSSVLDITSTDPDSVVSSDHAYTNAYNESLSTDKTNYKKYTWEQIGNAVSEVKNNYPQAPLNARNTSDGKNIVCDIDDPVNGEDIKNWIMQGIGGVDGFVHVQNIDFDNDNGRTNPNKETGTDGTSPGVQTPTNPIPSGTSANSIICNYKYYSYVVNNYPATPSDVKNVAEYKAKIEAKKWAGVAVANYIKAIAVKQAVYNYLVSLYGEDVALAAACRLTFSASSFGGSASLNNNDTLLASKKSIEDLGLQQIIPTDGETTSSGYLVKILNYKDQNGTRLIDFTDTSITITEDGGIVQVMAENGYYLIVEPVFWTRYSTLSHGKDTHFTYGSYRNLIDYYVSKGYTGSKPNTKALVTIYGWRCMSPVNTVTFANGAQLVGASLWNNDGDEDGDVETVSCAKLQECKTTVAYAMHVYGSKKVGTGGVTKTRDDSKLYKGTGKEHPAPEIPEDEKEKYDEKITIVKTYQVSKDGGKTYKHSSTHVRKDSL